MVKVARGKGEDARVTIRSMRRKAMEELDKHRARRRGGRGRGGPRREGAAGHRRQVRRSRSTSWSSTRKPSCSRSDDSQPSRDARRVRARQQRGKDRASGRAGRNLVAAIGVGVGLGAVVLASLLIERHWFIPVVALAAAVGTWELAGALRRGADIRVRCRCCSSAGRRWCGWPGRSGPRPSRSRSRPPRSACWSGGCPRGAEHYVRDVTAGVFTAAYVPLLCSFAALMVVAPDGAARVLAFMICVVASDVGGYTAGVLAGKHPMAPTISPKKSWEGFAGSVVAGMVAGALSVVFLLHGPWWQGVLSGRAAGRRRDARGPHRVADQARPRGQGHGQPAARPRRHDGPDGLAAAVRGPSAAAAAPSLRPAARTPAPTSGTGPRSTRRRTPLRTSRAPSGRRCATRRPWTGRDVVDIGCGDGYHLPFFDGARSVLGVEPYAPLVNARRPRGCRWWWERPRGSRSPPRPSTSSRPHRVLLRQGLRAGAGRGVAGAAARRRARDRRPRRHVPPYGEWMRADIPHYDPWPPNGSSRDRASPCAGSRRRGASPTALPARPCCASSSRPLWPTARSRSAPG